MKPYRISIEFSTDRPLTVAEVSQLAWQASLQIEEPILQEQEKDNPFEVEEVALRAWMGDREVGGLNPMTPRIAYAVTYAIWENPSEDWHSETADDTDFHVFATEEEAERLADEWLHPEAWETGSRVQVWIRYISVPDWAIAYLQTETPTAEQEQEWDDFVYEDLWNPSRRVGELMRVWRARL